MTQSPPPEDLAALEALRAQFLTAMRGLVSSVCIITSRDASGNRCAMTATSPTSLSLEPPSMLICVNRGVPFSQIMQAGQDFCINILGQDHVALAHLSAGAAKGEARFAQGDWRADDTGLPYLHDATSAIFCTQEQRIPYGSHDIIIGKVRAIHSTTRSNPLIYAEGSYRTVGDDILE